MWAAESCRPRGGRAAPGARVQSVSPAWYRSRASSISSPPPISTLATTPSLDSSAVSPTEVPDRYRTASPAALKPIGVRQVIVHGLDDTVIPSSMSEHYARVASAAGDEVDFVGLPGIGHHEVIVPSGAPFLALTDGIEKLIASVG